MKTQHSRDAARVQSQTAEQIAAIRADEHLTAAGKRAKISEIYSTAKGDLQRLRSDQRETLLSRRDQLEGDLFGKPPSNTADLVAFRDAVDRAENCRGQKDAAALLARAEASGDQQLSMAVARHAVERNWGRVFGEWLSKRPSLSPVVDELSQIDDHLAGMGNGEMFTFALSEPKEARGTTFGAPVPVDADA